MEEDKFALVEKILKDVESIMSKNAELISFDIVPVDTNFQNKSPVLHLENCLGLESWCVKHVYMYCYGEVMDSTFAKSKRRSLKVSSTNADRLKMLLNLTLLINPELNTLWNKRREMVIRRMLDKMSEFRFTRLVLSRKPKCNEAFAYRKWLLEGILQDQNLQTNIIDYLINDELNVCELASDKSPNNYHSWSHRMWLLRKMKELNKQYNLNLLYLKEYEHSERWTGLHVSDHSCFHYRQFCLKSVFSMSSEDSWKLFQSNLNIELRKGFIQLIATNFPKDITIEATEDDLVSYSDIDLTTLLLGDSFRNCQCPTNHFLICRQLEVLFRELILNNELVRFYKLHETLWYHRRFIVHEIVSVIYDYFGLQRKHGAPVKDVCRKCHPEQLTDRQTKIVKYDSSSVYSSILFRALLSHEQRFTAERRVPGDRYADRHDEYLKYVEGFNQM